MPKPVESVVRSEAVAGEAPATQADLLIAIARRELALQGSRALSFRRLAAAGGVTLATLSYHLGSKADIVQQLLDAERQRDARWHDIWQARLASVRQFDPATLAATVEGYLDDAQGEADAGAARLTSLIWADLLLRAGVDTDLAVRLRPWLQARRDFWRALLAGRIVDSVRWADAVFAYVSDEGVHGLALGANADYRLLRRMAVSRLARRLDPAQRDGLAGSSLFDALVRRLDPQLGLPGPQGDSALLAPGRRRDIAVAACDVILEEGAEAVTHRAVGERLGIPASTVAYHCRSGRDLLRAGQEMVYLVAQGRMPAPGVDSPERRQRVTMRGTLAISLAAARDPELVPQAMDLRRLRGENLVHILRSTGYARVDGLDGQAAALAGLGATALAAADSGAVMAPGAVLDWLTEALRG